MSVENSNMTTTHDVAVAKVENYFQHRKSCVILFFKALIKMGGMKCSGRYTFLQGR